MNAIIFIRTPQRVQASGASLISKREPLTQRVREARQRGCPIGTREPVVAELFYGMELSASRDENLVRLRRALSRIACWPLDRRACSLYNTCSLRSKTGVLSERLAAG